ncbi:MAG: hypothetical protein GY925_00430 [Actinomycetia bacterium]|nr:hypothetical protein [Actinomycetes bacterium]
MTDRRSAAIHLFPLEASADIEEKGLATGTSAIFLASPPPLDDDTTVAAQMIASANEHGLDEPTDLGDWAIDAFDAERLLDRVPRPMSRGERQICGLLVALARPFDAIYAVDPTAGLDANRRRAVVEVLTDLAVDNLVVCASDDPLFATMSD